MSKQFDVWLSDRRSCCSNPGHRTVSGSSRPPIPDTAWRWDGRSPPTIERSRLSPRKSAATSRHRPQPLPSNLIKMPTLLFGTEKVHFYHFHWDLSNPSIFKSNSSESSWESLGGVFFEGLKNQPVLSPTDYTVFHRVEDFKVFYYGVSDFRTSIFLQLFYRSFTTAIPKYYQILISNFLRCFYM